MNPILELNTIFKEITNVENWSITCYSRMLKNTNQAK